jgi:hypothetical protein
VRNEEVLHRVKEERNILHTMKGRKANRIGHILRRNCILQHVIEGKIEVRTEVTARRGRRRTQLLEDLKKTRGLCQQSPPTVRLHNRTDWFPFKRNGMPLSPDNIAVHCCNDICILFHAITTNGNKYAHLCSANIRTRDNNAIYSEFPTLRSR